MSALFRSEVLEAKAQRLHGAVLIASTLPAWAVTAVVVAIAAGTLTWAGLATYARTETVAGVIASVDPIAKIVAPRPGLVTAVEVTEGATVRPGQRLAVIRIDQPSEGGGAPVAASLAAIEAQRRLAEDRLALEPQRIAAERQRLEAARAGADAQARQLAEQLRLQVDIARTAKASYEQIAGVVERGYMTRLEFERRRQGWLQAEQGLAVLRQQIGQAEAARAQALAELARLPIDAAATAGQFQSAVEQLAQARAQLSAQRGYAVVAPIAGRVTAVQIAPGKFADGRVPLMTIVPDRATMRADLYAPSRSMGFVREGQPVRLLYDAFPYQRFGSFGGQIIAIGRVVIAPGEIDAALDIREPVYRVSVRLDRQTVGARQRDIPLQPGMTLQGNIVLERRSFLDWLLAPVRAVRSRS